MIDHTIPSPAVPNARQESIFMDVFGGSGLTKATNHFGMRGYVLHTKFGPRV